MDLLQKSFEFLDFDLELNFPNNIEHRDVADIPNYHFRDDGLEIWFAIRTYVDNVINIFYETDKDVQEDFELQDWEKEIFTLVLCHTTYILLWSQKSIFYISICI